MAGMVAAARAAVTAVVVGAEETREVVAKVQGRVGWQRLGWGGRRGRSGGGGEELRGWGAEGESGGRPGGGGGDGARWQRRW